MESVVRMLIKAWSSKQILTQLMLLSIVATSCAPPKFFNSNNRNLASTTGKSVTSSTSPTLAWSPLVESYNSVNVGTPSSAKTFTLTNSGTAAATGCTAPTLSGTNPGEFSIQTDNCTTSDLALSATCTVLVVASPTSTGPKAATLSRTCTVGGVSSTTTDQITVVGTAPGLNWSPVVHPYGSLNVGSTSAAQTYTLSNTGSSSATGCSAPALAGTNSGDFSIQTDNCGTNNLDPSDTCTVLVTAGPTATGARAATLSRTCTVGGTSSTTADGLTVTGTAPSIAWTPLTQSFGSVNTGTTSGTQTITLTNSELVQPQVVQLPF